MMGTARARGIGVTRFTHCDASHGVRTGSDAIGRCFGQRRRGDQVVQNIADSDGLNKVADPFRRGHVGQNLGEVSDHFKTGRTRTNDDPGL